MVSMTSLYMLLGMAFEQLWLLEQPHSSVMIHHPRLVQVRQACGNKWKEVTTHMGAFGAATMKKTKLWSCDDMVLDLKRVPTPADKLRFAEAPRLATVDPITGGVSGSKHLKASQAYPPEYGKMVFEAWNTRVANVDNNGANIDNDGFDDVDSIDDEDIPAGEMLDLWPDTELQKTLHNPSRAFRPLVGVKQGRRDLAGRVLVRLSWFFLAST